MKNLSVTICVAVAFASLAVFTPAMPAQTEDLRSDDAKTRARAAKTIGNRGQRGEGDPKVFCEALGQVVTDPARQVREEAVIALIKVGGQHCLEPLKLATKDANPDVQSLAVDGLVNFYMPGYVRFGWLNSIRSFAGNLKGRFSQPEPTIVEPYINVPSDIVSAIAPLITGGSSMESRANAARATGILRGNEAIPELKQALKATDSTVVVEAIRSIEKIADPSVGPDLVPLLRHLDRDVQLAAADAVGQLRTREAVDNLVGLINGSPHKNVQRAAIIALAKIPDNGQDKLFLMYLRDKDNQMRAAAAEGIGRLRNPSDLKTVQDLFAQEGNESARLSMAFAAVHLGDLTMVQYLVDGLDSRVRRGEARAFLVELARQPKVLAELYTPLTSGTKNQKIELAHVISRSGTRDSLQHLDRLSRDSDADVADAALTAMKNLQARI